MTLPSLFARALISQWDQDTWFEGVKLVGASLLVPDVHRAQTILRCFLPRLQEVMPELTITAVTPAARAKDAGPRRAYRGQGAFKQGKRPADALAAAEQVDLLGEGE